MAEDTGVIQSRKDFRDSNAYWKIEIGAALKDREDFVKIGDEATKRFLDDRKDSGGPTKRLNLYHSNVSTERALLYGKTPSVDVGRRFNDSKDDVARIASEGMERILNTDIEQDDDGFSSGLRYAVEDWTCPGLGVLWMRYETGEEVEGETAKEAMTGACPECAGAGCESCDGTGEVETAPAVPAVMRRPEEDCEADFVFWKDFLWSPCRNWHEVRWVARRVEVTKDEAEKRKWKDLQYKSARTNKDGDTPEDIKDAWSRAEVWEIWCREDRTVYFYNEGCPHIVEKRQDPLELDGFLPCPRPLMRNVSTGKLMPKADYALAKDHYDEVDRLTERISYLVNYAKLRWAYDGSVPELRRIFDELNEGQGVAVTNWAALQEKGGLTNVIQFAPLKECVESITLLAQRRQEEIALMYQVTGMSDIIRGQAAQRATATEQSIKAQFASTRIQTAQDELARFASEAQQLRAEIISKHFQPETIVERANLMQTTADPKMVQQAVQLIKSDFWQFRIAVRPESIALPDMATQRQERTEAVQGLGAYFQAMMPLVQAAGMAGPQGVAATMTFITETGQWMIAGLRGASEVEDAFDKYAEAIKQFASQPPPPPQPDPQLEVAKVKAQAEMGKAQATQQQTAMDMQASQMEHQQKMREMALKGAQDRIKAQTQIQVNQSKPPPPTGGPNA